MKELMHTDNSLVDFEIYGDRLCPAHTHGDIEILYVLDGRTTLTLGHATYPLAGNSCVIINSNEVHGMESAGEVLFACVHIRYPELCRRLGVAQIGFDCNTALLRDARHAKLQDLLMQVFNQYDARPMYRENFYLEGLYLHLVDYIARSFRMDQPRKRDGEHARDERLREITDLIHAGCKTPLTLGVLAESLYLSESYLSKYIKRHFGMTFSEYLGEVRLGRAIDDLKSGSKSLTRVALDNGFPNTASFNRVFRKKFGTNPSGFKNTLRGDRAHGDMAQGDGAPPAADKGPSSPKTDIRQYLRSMSPTPRSTPGQAVQIRVPSDANPRRPFERGWGRMFNMGAAIDLFNSDICEHMATVREELGCEYVRFWDIYSPLMLLDAGMPGKSLNFTKMDRLFDILASHGLKPYIELGFKPRQVISSNKIEPGFIIFEPKPILFATPQAYGDFLRAFISHYAIRYGRGAVENWYFEQWFDPRQIQTEGYGGYFSMFDAAHKALKGISPHIRLGGGGLSVETDYYRDFLKTWHSRRCQPDFLGIYSFPYTTMRFGKMHLSLQAQVDELRKGAVEAGFQSPTLHVSEWNFAASDRDMLHDSCFKAAYIVKNVLESMDRVGMMGYWTVSDLNAESSDTNCILSGSGGLISKDGIKKPSYYAFWFLSRMGRYLLSNDPGCAVTTDGFGDFSVLCHNYQAPNFKYFLNPGNETPPSEHHSLFESCAQLDLQVRIEGVRNGRYIVKTHRVNEESASILDEWLRMDCMAHFNKDEIDYLKRTCVPKLSIETVHVTNHVLVLEPSLMVQEIRYIHAIYIAQG
ncbi:MAG: helix-turn-helix domain-containing protein [Lachnospiraceae bacterium]|jgi:beta-xylosidase/AraC-like DNA-binding protein|nr:helix-turn-helix domain-containing protein [Lachnospiraceae bacterium]